MRRYEVFSLLKEYPGLSKRSVINILRGVTTALNYKKYQKSRLCGSLKEFLPEHIETLIQQCILKNEIFILKRCYKNKQYESLRLTQRGERLLNNLQIYEELLKVAWEDKRISKDEDNLLRKIKKRLQISSEDEQKIKENIGMVGKMAYPPRIETKYGVYVRSKSEMIIYHALVENGIEVLYEKKIILDGIPIYPDFYLPQYDIYIEYWGLEKDEDYKKIKEIKENLYTKHKINYISIYEKEMENIYSVLKQKLETAGAKIKWKY